MLTPLNRSHASYERWSTCAGVDLNPCSKRRTRSTVCRAPRRRSRACGGSRTHTAAALFEDELVVHQSRGVVLTPTADQIYAGLRSALTCPNREFDLTDNV